jgi:hypothetical protein
MRRLLAATCLTPVLFIAAPAQAETVISTAVTTGVATGTANDNLRISSTGSVKPASGVAVTVNSNDDVKNEGTIQITGANNAAGIVANPNLFSDITNTGSIIIDEDFTPTDSDSDGDVDGPFAQGSGRFGIHVLSGGTHSGNIVNSGTITIEGNQSAAISIDSALTGSVLHSGSISVTGNDTFGIRAQSVSGNVTLRSGTLSVKGQNATGVSLEGNVGGAVVIQSAVISTGYRSTTAPADTSKLDADDLLQGGSAVAIGGNVAGGIIFDTRPADASTTDDDEDDDGVIDTQEGNASITTFGSAPAVKIGSATQSVTVGAIAGQADGHGLVNKGIISGLGVYKGVAANGMSIGGLGQTVTIAGGMTNTGGITAVANEANAVGLRIGTGAAVPTIKNSGTISAGGGGTASTGAQAILIDTGANVGTIRNSGVIAAARAGTAGTAAAIVDKSGTVTLLENSGAITVTNAATLGASAIAFDFSANGGGTTVRQLAVASGTAAPTIAGTMLFGGGSDIFEINDGFVTGDASFGLGNNRLTLAGDAVMTGASTFGSGADTVQLGGTSKLTGNIDFGTGSDVLTLAGTSAFRGNLTNSGGLAITAGAGTRLDVTNTGTVNLASLSVGAGATIGISLDQGANAVTLYNVAGTADFGAGAKVDVTLLSLGGVTGTYKILQAGTLTGASNLTSSIESLPFLFASSLNTATAGEVSLVVRQKTTAELGINQSEASILGAVIASADSDAPVANIFLGAQDSDSLRSALQEMLPEHAGGAFEMVTRGSRLAAGILGDPKPILQDDNTWGLWANQVFWGTSKSIGSTSSYDLTGWGVAAGLERSLGGAGAAGLSLSYLTGKDSKGDDSLMSSQYEGGLYWRGGTGPLRGFARATLGHVDFDGTRNLTIDGVTRTTEGDWTGTVYSLVAGASYDARFGRFGLRPSAQVEHFNLKEKGYQEEGGGSAFDLTVRSRKSDETAVVGLVALGYDLLSLDRNEPWMRIELEGGRREILSGSLGSTTASFAGGQPFTLTPEERTSGWRAGLRLTGGGPSLALGAEVNGEEQQGKASIGGRIGIQLAL